MTRIDHGVIRQCGEQASYRLRDLASASRREIRAAVGACKQGITGEENLFFFNIVTAGTDGVSRCFKYFPCKSGDGKLVAFFHRNIRCQRIRFPVVAGYKAFSAV